MVGSSVNLVFTGDLMLGGDYLNKMITESNFESALFRILKESSYIINNFENTIGFTPHKRVNKEFLLHCSINTFDSYVDLFPNSIFCIGNNHICDFGREGFIKTIEHIKSRNIEYYGAGTIEEAKKPLVINENIALLNFSTDEYFVNSIIAESDTVGCIKYDVKEIEKVIKELRQHHEFLIVTFHWGYEKIILPSQEQISLAHDLIDMGVDLIIGHHPHIIQPFEIYKDKYIFYSLGNYFFPNFYDIVSGLYYQWEENSRRSLCVQIEIEKGNPIGVKIHGLKFDIKSFALNLDQETRDFALNLSKLFENLGRKEDYDEFFNRYIECKYKLSLTEKLYNFISYFVKRNKYSLFKRITVKSKILIGKIKSQGIKKVIFG